MIARKKLLKVGVLFVFFMILCSCGKQNEESEEKHELGLPQFTIQMAEDHDNYEIIGENEANVARGSDAFFTIVLKEGKKVSSISRIGGEIDYDLKNNTDGTETIVIKDVRFSFAFSVNCESTQTRIAYYANGGQFVGSSDKNQPLILEYSLKHRLRPNTDIGDGLLDRDGYILTGWNSEKDGNGFHTGLGSRVTVEEGSTLNLYAEWQKETDSSSFEYENHGEFLLVSKYTGQDTTVTIPKEHKGIIIKGILKGAFSDVPEVKKVIISPNVEAVYDGAFEGSKIQEVWIYDNIRRISDDCFRACDSLTSVHINAVQKPRYGSDLYSEYNLADKYDILILNKEKQKVVVFGGSGAFFSFNPKEAEQLLDSSGKDYICINMAVNGWFNGIAQFDMISPYLSKGDVFIHIPEPSSGMNLMYYTTMIPAVTGFDYNKLRFYYSLESNYDLFSLIDLRCVDDFFDGFNEFNEARADLPEKEYEDYKTQVSWYFDQIDSDLGYIDNRGGFALPRERGIGKEAGEADVVVEYVTDKDSVERLNRFYDTFLERGIRVFFVTAPTNIDTLKARLSDPEAFQHSNGDDYLFFGRPDGINDPDYKEIGEWISAFDDAVNSNLHVEVILPLAQTLYTTEVFSEPDYHLSDEQSSIYTSEITKVLLDKLTK